jgi:hypothetical protein
MVRVRPHRVVRVTATMHVMIVRVGMNPGQKQKFARYCRWLRQSSRRWSPPTVQQHQASRITVRRSRIVARIASAVRVVHVVADVVVVVVAVMARRAKEAAWAANHRSLVATSMPVSTALAT